MKHPSKWSKGEAGMVFISLPLLWGLVSALIFLVTAYGLVVIDVFAAVLSLTVGGILLHQHREAEHKRGKNGTIYNPGIKCSPGTTHDHRNPSLSEPARRPYIKNPAPVVVSSGKVISKFKSGPISAECNCTSCWAARAVVDRTTQPVV